MSSIIIIEDLSKIFTGDTKNNYSIFKNIENKYGVYIFLNLETNEILYIGEAKKQNLKERIKQNFTKNDSGGTFRDNYLEKENNNFTDFIEFIKNSKLVIITSPQNIIISALEAILINILKPKYNKET